MCLSLVPFLLSYPSFCSFIPPCLCSLSCLILSFSLFLMIFPFTICIHIVFIYPVKFLLVHASHLPLCPSTRVLPFLFASPFLAQPSSGNHESVLLFLTCLVLGSLSSLIPVCAFLIACDVSPTCPIFFITCSASFHSFFSCFFLVSLVFHH